MVARGGSLIMYAKDGCIEGLISVELGHLDAVMYCIVLRGC